LNGQLRIELGHALEGLVASLYVAETGRQVRRDSREYTAPELPLVGHIDRRIVGEPRGLECKTSLSRWLSDDWTDEADGIPHHYLCQVYGYLMVTGWPCWDVAVLRAGPEFRVYSIVPDAEFMDALRTNILSFWECVQRDIPPEPANLEDVKRRWPVARDLDIPADDGLNALVAALRVTKAELDRQQVRYDALQQQLCAAMGDAQAIVGTHGKPLATWKSQTSRRIDTTLLREQQPEIAEQYVRETQSRVFRLMKEKA
jgi:predicted phage-related endonuclease